MRQFRALSLVVLSVVLALALTGCGAESPRDVASESMPDARSAAGGDAALDAAAPRQLIKTARLEIRVDDPQAVARQARSLVEERGGFPDVVSSHRRGEVREFSLTLRVPVGELEAVLGEIEDLAQAIDVQSITSEDVTAQMVDLGARRRTLEATEQELRQLLAESRERRREVEEIMAVYQRLTEIRTQIERIAAQETQLGRQVALSTIYLEVRATEAAIPVAREGWNPGDTVLASVRALVGFLRFLVDALIWFVVVGLPVGLVTVGVVWGLVRLRWAWRRLIERG